MRNSLRSHILYLEQTIQDLTNRLTSSRLNVDEVQDIELQLALAESALEHYRKAFALESSVSGSEPPGQNSENGSSGATDRPGNSSPDKDKGRLAAVRARRREVQRPHRVEDGSQHENRRATTAAWGKLSCCI